MLQNLTYMVHEHHQNLSEEAEIRSNDLEQKINTTRIEDRLDRQDHWLNTFNESLVQTARNFREELNETEVQLNQSMDRTLHDLNVLSSELNITREEITNMTNSAEELKELLLNKLTAARNDTNTLRNELISETTNLSMQCVTKFD